MSVPRSWIRAMSASIPAPYWVSYPDMAMLADGVPVFIYAGADRATRSPPAQLAAAITPRTQDAVPQQPEQSHRRRLHQGRTARRSGRCSSKHPQIVIAADEMYEHIYWAAEPFTSFAQANPQLYDRTVTINGVSKAYAMTGWRIGYCGGPEGHRGGDGHDPGPVHLECLEHLAARRDRGAERRPSLRRSK